MRYIKYFLLFLIFLVSIIFFSFHSVLEKHTSRSDQEIEYTLNKDFFKVKKVMLRTNVLEAIAAKEHGEIIEKKWDNFVFSSNRPLRDGVDIEAQGFFVIEKNDPDIGKLQLSFKQAICATKLEFKSDTYLLKSNNCIKNIQTNLIMFPSKEIGKTLVKVKIVLEYERILPKNMIDKVNKMIEKSVANSLDANKNTITELVEKYADKRFILPLSELPTR